MNANSDNVLAFPEIEIPPTNTAIPQAYEMRQWIYSLRLTRREMREGLASGKFQPTPDFMTALREVEWVLERTQHIS